MQMSDEVNVLIICSDQHARDISGCYGDTVVRTPAIDALAERGTVFETAYCASPCCVPTRASIQTGRWVHQHGFWSSAEPYDGSLPGWGHRLKQEGRFVMSIGKLHFRSSADDNGFSEERLPVHVMDGIGFTSMLVRDGREPFRSNVEFARDIGAGESGYTRFDRRVCERTCSWLAEESVALGQPWTLFCSMVAPHHPIIAPAAFHRLYRRSEFEMPRHYGHSDRPDHPVVDAFRKIWDYDRHFRDEEHVLAVRHAYYAYVSFLDHNVGQVLAALETSGQTENTLVIYLSDHGELLGNHGLWAKMNMYEESAAIPLIAAGPGFPAKARCSTPASQVDLHQTVLLAHRIESDDDIDLPGTALQELAAEGSCNRAVLSEYHERGAVTGMFMLRWRNWKYIAYPGFPPQLFDMDNDPFEGSDLGQAPGFEDTRAACDAKLRTLVDYEDANSRCFADQALRIGALGGRAAALNDGDHALTPMPEV